MSLMDYKLGQNLSQIDEKVEESLKAALWDG